MTGSRGSRSGSNYRRTEAIPVTEGTYVPVQIRIPFEHYWTVNARLDLLGYGTLQEYVEKQLQDLALQSSDPVELLVRDGECDAAIAERLHLTKGTVADRRRKLGLRPNPPRYWNPQQDTPRDVLRGLLPKDTDR